MPKRPVESPITDKEMAFAHLIMAGTLTDRRAAEAVGIDPGRAAYVKAKPRVKAYMEQHRASVRAGLVEHEVEALVEFNIGREQILTKYWEFANIDPKLTGYNTSSQSKALDSLWHGLGFDESKNQKEPERVEPPDVYRAAWMREREAGPNIYKPKWMREREEEGSSRDGAQPT